MVHWCGSGREAVAIVEWMELREGQVPFGVPEGTPPMDAGEAARSVSWWFDERNVGSARSLFVDLGYSLDYVNRHDINARLASDFESGHLVAYPMRPSGSLDDGGGRTTPQGRSIPKNPPSNIEYYPPKEQKTFVLIELVDDADPPQPVAYEKYRIELTDGSVREGMLDQNGQAEMSGIDPGDCKVTFPNLLRDLHCRRSSSTSIERA